MYMYLYCYHVEIFIVVVGYASSCKQLKEQTSIRQDGSYKLFVHGRLLEVLY